METGEEGEGSAVRALGPLLRTTEVFLWDDGFGGNSTSSVHHNSVAKQDSSGFHNSVSYSEVSSTMEEYTSMEDLELARRMNALGLPTSFKTNKEKRHIATGGKRKVKKTISAHKDTEKLLEVPRLGEQVDSSPSQVFDDSKNTSICCTTMQSESETTHYADMPCNIAIVDCKSDSGSQAATVGEIVKEQVCDETTDMMVTDSMAVENKFASIDSSRNTEALIHPNGSDFNSLVVETSEDAGHIHCWDEKLSCPHRTDKGLEDIYTSEFVSVDLGSSECISDISRCHGDLRDWTVVWDAFYMRNYFYNIHTQESTWHPPPGLENLGFTVASNEIIADAADEDISLRFSCSDSKDMDALQETGSSQKALHNGNVSGQSSQELISGLNYATKISTSDIDLFTVSSCSNHLDEHVEEISFSEINVTTEDPNAVPFHSLYADSFGNSVNHLDSEDVCDSDAHLTSMKSKTDELNLTEHPDKSENITSQGAWNLMDDIPLRLSLGSRSTNAFNEIGPEMNWNNDIVFVSDDLHSHDNVDYHKRKKKVRGRSHKKIISGEDKGAENVTLPGTMEGISADIVKYWCQRYLLFSKFDDGVKLDEEGWFSVTPETIARHQASRSCGGTVIDCFAGVGGNAIQFAMRSSHVIAIDIDPQKVSYAQHNAIIYGVEDNIDFLQGDFFHVGPHLKGDTVFMSPPWGGPDYAKVQTYDIRTMLKPRDGYLLFKIAVLIASKVVMFLPRNVDLNQLAELSLLVHPPWELEVEKNYLNGRLKGITAYFTDTSLQMAG